MVVSFSIFKVSSVFYIVPCLKFSNWNVNIIKLSKHITAPVLTTIFNNCVAEGIYPDALKVAKVIPIHKSGDISNPSKYRPISIVPHFSKIFEKILLKVLQSFLDQSNILFQNQFFFRKVCSTIHALMSLNDIITSNREENLYTWAIFLDLKQAFDTVDHSILMKKYIILELGVMHKIFSQAIYQIVSSLWQLMHVNQIKNI